MQSLEIFFSLNMLSNSFMLLHATQFTILAIAKYLIE